MNTKEFSDELKKRRLATGMSLPERREKRKQDEYKQYKPKTKSPKGIGVGWGG